MGKLYCPYCAGEAKLVKGDSIYKGIDLDSILAGNSYWHCEGCDAYVGCHDGTDTPLGSLANHELRVMRNDAHRAFDRLWRSGGMTRNRAYKWLAEKLGIPVNECHVAMFGMEMCRKVLIISKREHDRGI